MKKKILLFMTTLLLLSQLVSCNPTQKVIDNVSKTKISRNPHVAAWIAGGKDNSIDGINNFLFVYKTFTEGQNLYKVVVLREDREKQADVSLEFVEEGNKLTVKIHFADKNKPADDGHTVSYIEFKAAAKYEVIFDVICEGDSREIFQFTDVNIAM